MVIPLKELPTLYCQQCGNQVPHRIAKRRDMKKAGHWRPAKFCSKSCAMLARGANARGHIDKHGYRVLPSGGRGKPQIYEHRKVMEDKLGRKLTKKETVHHKNGDRLDNRPENLEVWAGRHGKGQRVADLFPYSTNDYMLGALSLGA